MNVSHAKFKVVLSVVLTPFRNIVAFHLPLILGKRVIGSRVRNKYVVIFR